jgi:hypothetical protein
MVPDITAPAVRADPDASTRACVDNESNCKVDAPVFVLVALKTTSSPSTYDVLTGLKVTAYASADPDSVTYVAEPCTIAVLTTGNKSKAAMTAANSPSTSASWAVVPAVNVVNLE